MVRREGRTDYLGRNDGRCVRAHDNARIRKSGSLGGSPVSAHRGSLQERAEERCFGSEHRPSHRRCPKGGWECIPGPHIHKR